MIDVLHKIYELKIHKDKYYYEPYKKTRELYRISSTKSISQIRSVLVDVIAEFRKYITI